MRHRSTTAIAALIAAYTVFIAPPAAAATFVVTKTADTADGSCDSSDCSLREAIIAANGLAGDDVITLPAGVYVLTKDGTGEDAANTGDLDVTESLTINGEDPATTIIHGGGGGLVTPPDRVFQVLSPAGFSINHVTVRNGAPPFDGGAGILMEGDGGLAVDDCVFLDNHGSPSAGGGGIAYLASGASPAPVFSIRGSVFVGNTADRFGGGLVSADASLTIEASEFRYNTATGGSAFAANGSNGGTVTISGSDFSGNIVTPDIVPGGTVAVTGIDMTMTGSTVSDNTGTNTGSGIACIPSGADTTTMTIVDSTISGNVARGCGGLFKKGGVLTLTGVTVENNRAYFGACGGVGFGGDALTIDGNSVIRGNVAENEGGGVVVTGTPGTTTILIEDSLVEGNASYREDAGGIYAEDADLTVRRSVVRGNFANSGAGLHAAGSTAVTIEDSTVEGNSAAEFGGGLSDIANAPLTIVNSTFNDNFATTLGGGLVFVSAAAASVENSTFSGNEGGGLAVTGPMDVVNSTFFGNAAGFNGAAIVGNGVITVTNSALVSETGANCPHAYLSGGGNIDADGSCLFVGTGDQNVDPQLGPLADNGGPTKTHAPLPGSPAIDGGENASCLAKDQRGVSRPLDGNIDGDAVCDVGAVELTTCGDGVVQEGEECDDGNAADGDECNADCTLPSPDGDTTGGDTAGGDTTGGDTSGADDSGGGCSLVR